MLLDAVVAVCVACHAAASAATVPLPEKIYYDLEDAENLFKQHIKSYKRNYSTEEYKKRLEIYKNFLVEVNELNIKLPNTTFEANFFADMTPDEKEKYLGFVLPPSNEGSVTPVFPDGFEAPDELDYRKQGIVTSVKNLKKCYGATSIFSIIANLEGQYAMKHKKLIPLSEQQPMDCMGGFSCDRIAHTILVLGYLADNRNGSIRESEYPYTGVVDETCQEKQGLVTVTGWQALNIPDEEVLKKALVHYGPLSVALIGEPLLKYKGGILNPPTSPSWLITTALLVGYGTENGTPFWILKNFWGTAWGEQGYFRLIRGKNALNMGTNQYTVTGFVA